MTDQLLTLHAAIRECRKLNRTDPNGETYTPAFVRTGLYQIAVFDVAGEYVTTIYK